MSVSSIGSATAQQLLQPMQSSAEGVVEGNIPDRDSDRDDVNTVAATVSVNNSSQITESIGQNINVYA